MSFTEQDLTQALGQQLLSFWQLQKQQEEQWSVVLAEKDKEIAALREELAKKEARIEER